MYFSLEHILKCGFDFFTIFPSNHMKEQYGKKVAIPLAFIT
jgi:hypothetical protein